MNILHQIYFDLGKGKTLRKISDFALCYDKTEVFCKNNNIQHKLWTEKDVEDFCEWVCAKATRLGFDVRVVDEDKRVD